MNRNRPRLNITLDREVKEKISTVADGLELPLSRLIEEILRDFIRQYNRDENVGKKIAEAASKTESQGKKIDSDELEKEINSLLDEVSD